MEKRRRVCGRSGDGIYQGYKTGTPPRVNEIHDVNDIKKYYDIYANGVKLPDAVIEYVDGFDMEKAQEVQADGNLPIQNVLWRLVETGNARFSLPDEGIEKAAPTQFRLSAKVLTADDIVTL